ncbi:MAG: lysostaphin resistance A-like protein [Waterburya sp.]
MFNTSWIKIFAFFGVWASIWLPIALVIYRFIGWQPNQSLIPKQKLILLGSLYALTPLIISWKIKVENLSLAHFGLPQNPDILPAIILGLILSLVSLMIIFCLESILGLVSWDWQNIQQLFSSILPILGLSLFISLVEELVFRGYTFTILLTDHSYWFAATISSLIFALLHLIWERKTTLPQIPGLWLMGMILVAARLVNNDSIYLALGLHAGWIWGLTCIDSAQLVTYNHQNNWFTGINSQPLAGMAGLSCLAFTGLILWLIMNNQLLVNWGKTI